MAAAKRSASCTLLISVQGTITRCSSDHSTYVTAIRPVGPLRSFAIKAPSLKAFAYPST